MKRYLPERAWHLLTDEQKNSTDRKKRKAGTQYVPNTPPAQAARAYVDHHDATRLDENQLQRIDKCALLQHF
ncbi:MAG: hypothetical protein GF401_14375 [Chitinivibrionales bacterium]|nr:hypothetical protein [Chitinivibrionales bacterium]